MRGALVIANDEFPVAAEIQWSLLRLELSDYGFEIEDIEAHRLWFEDRIKSSSEKYRDIPSEMVRSQVLRDKSLSGQIYRYFGGPRGTLSGPTITICDGTYVVAPPHQNARLSNSQLLLPCYSLIGEELGDIPSVELAIVPGSRVVRGEIAIHDSCDESAAQKLAHLHTHEQKAKADEYYGKYLKRASETKAQ
jgi:hypothetical protein